jgi:hypothetical protein
MRYLKIQIIRKFWIRIPADSGYSKIRIFDNTKENIHALMRIQY